MANFYFIRFNHVDICFVLMDVKMCRVNIESRKYNRQRRKILMFPADTVNVPAMAVILII